jgi:hypothetical protein
MSRASRRAGEERTLEIEEARFRSELIDALRRCANGEWGVLAQNDAAIRRLGRQVRERLRPRGVLELLELGERIDALRARLGFPPYPLYRRFLEYRRSDANTLGEPALARRFLAEIEAD